MQFALLFAGSMFFLCLSGCGGDGGLQPTTGSVVFEDGAPVKQGRIKFHPVPKGRLVTGQIIDGKFELNTNKMGDGVAPGEYKVSFSVTEAHKGNSLDSRYVIADEYLQKTTTPFSVTVSEELHTFDFELKRASDN